MATIFDEIAAETRPPVVPAAKPAAKSENGHPGMVSPAAAPAAAPAAPARTIFDDLAQRKPAAATTPAIRPWWKPASARPLTPTPAPVAAAAPTAQPPEEIELHSMAGLADTERQAAQEIATLNAAHENLPATLAKDEETGRRDMSRVWKKGYAGATDSRTQAIAQAQQLQARRTKRREGGGGGFGELHQPTEEHLQRLTGTYTKPERAPELEGDFWDAAAEAAGFVFGIDQKYDKVPPPAETWRDNPKGVGESLLEVQPIPFHPGKMVRLGQTRAAFGRLERSGEKGYAGRGKDIDLVERYMLQQLQAQARGQTISAKVAVGLADMVVWMAEFASTAGLASAGQAGAKKAGTYALGRYAKTKIGQVAIKGVGWVGGATARAAGGLQHKVIAGTYENMLPSGYHFEGDSLIIDEAGDSPAKAYVRSLGSVIVEAASEEAGATIVGGAKSVLGKIPGSRKVFGKLAKRLRAAAPKGSWAKLVRGGFDATKWDGFVGEMGEETLGDILRGAFSLDKNLKGMALWDRLVESQPGGEELLVRAIVLSVPGVAQMAANSTIGKVQQNRRIDSTISQIEQNDPDFAVLNVQRARADKEGNTEEVARLDQLRDDWRADIEDQLRSHIAGEEPPQIADADQPDISGIEPKSQAAEPETVAETTETPEAPKAPKAPETVAEAVPKVVPDSHPAAAAANVAAPPATTTPQQAEPAAVADETAPTTTEAPKEIVAAEAEKPAEAKPEPAEGAKPAAATSHSSLEDIDAAYPVVKGDIDGRAVRAEVPNLSSIGASIDNPQELPGVRQVQMSQFTLDGDSTPTDAPTLALAEEIRNSGELNPLIVAIDENGPYIVEGGHRYGALKVLGAKSFPAVVVIEVDDAFETAEAAKPAEGKQPAAATAEPITLHTETSAGYDVDALAEAKNAGAPVAEATRQLGDHADGESWDVAGWTFTKGADEYGRGVLTTAKPAEGPQVGAAVRYVDPKTGRPRVGKMDGVFPASNKVNAGKARIRTADGSIKAVDLGVLDSHSLESVKPGDAVDLPGYKTEPTGVVERVNEDGTVAVRTDATGRLLESLGADQVLPAEAKPEPAEPKKPEPTTPDQNEPIPTIPATEEATAPDKPTKPRPLAPLLRKLKHGQLKQLAAELGVDVEKLKGKGAAAKIRRKIARTAGAAAAEAAGRMVDARAVAVETAELADQIVDYHTAQIGPIDADRADAGGAFGEEADQYGHDALPTRFGGALPTELREGLQGRFQLMRLISVDKAGRSSEAADALAALGTDEYIARLETLAAGKAGDADRAIDAVRQFAAATGDAEMQIKLARYDAVSESDEIAAPDLLTAGDLAIGQTCTIGGATITVVNARGGLVEIEGAVTGPVSPEMQIPADRGSLTAAPPAAAGEEAMTAANRVQLAKSDPGTRAVVQAVVARGVPFELALTVTEATRTVRDQLDAEHGGTREMYDTIVAAGYGDKLAGLSGPELASRVRDLAGRLTIHGRNKLEAMENGLVAAEVVLYSGHDASIAIEELWEAWWKTQPAATQARAAELAREYADEQGQEIPGGPLGCMEFLSSAAADYAVARKLPKALGFTGKGRGLREFLRPLVQQFRELYHAFVNRVRRMQAAIRDGKVSDEFAAVLQGPLPPTTAAALADARATSNANPSGRSSFDGSTFAARLADDGENDARERAREINRRIRLAKKGLPTRPADRADWTPHGPTVSLGAADADAFIAADDRAAVDQWEAMRIRLAAREQGRYEGQKEIAETHRQLRKAVEVMLPAEMRLPLVQAIAEARTPGELRKVRGRIERTVERVNASLARTRAMAKLDEALAGLAIVPKKRGSRKKASPLLPEHQAALVELFADIKMHGISPKTRSRLKHIIADAVASPELVDMGAEQYSPGFAKLYNAALETMAQQDAQPIRAMAPAQIEQLANLVLGIRKQSELKGTLEVAGELRDLVTATDEATGDVASQQGPRYKPTTTGRDNPARPGWSRQQWWAQEKPENLILKLGPREGTVAHRVLYQGVYDGSGRAKAIQQQYADRFRDKLADRGVDLSDWRTMTAISAAAAAGHNARRGLVAKAVGALPGHLGKRASELIEIDLPTATFAGKPLAGKLEITGGELISILAAMEDPYQLQILLAENSGGISLGRMRRETSAGKGVVLKWRDLQAIKAAATDQDRAIVEVMMGELQDIARRHLNPAWNANEGFNIAENEQYWPVTRNMKAIQGVDRNPLDYISESSSANFGIFQDRQGGLIPLVIKDAFEVYFTHVNQVATYVGLYAPLKAAKRMLATPRYGRAIASRFGEAYLRLLNEQLDAVGGLMQTKSPGPGARIVNAVKKPMYIAALGFKPFVMAKQTASFLFALDEMHPGDWAVGLKTLLTGATAGVATANRAVRAEMRQHSPQLRARYEGSGRLIQGPTMDVSPMRIFYAGTDKREWSMAGIQGFDWLAISGIWSAAKHQVKREGVAMPTEKYWQRVNEIAMRVVNRTQPDFDVANRSQMARNAATDAGSGVLTMFTSMRNGLLNMVTRSLWRFGNERKTNPVGASGRLMFTLVLVTAAGTALMHYLDELRNWFYRGGKPTKREYRKTTGGHLLEAIGEQASIVYGAGDAVELLINATRGERRRVRANNPVQALGWKTADAIKLLADLAKTKSGEQVQSGPDAGKPKGRALGLRAAEKVVDAVALGLGLPVAGPKSAAKGVWRFVEGEEPEVLLKDEIRDKYDELSAAVVAGKDFDFEAYDAWRAKLAERGEQVEIDTESLVAGVETNLKTDQTKAFYAALRGGRDDDAAAAARIRWVVGNGNPVKFYRGLDDRRDTGDLDDDQHTRAVALLKRVGYGPTPAEIRAAKQSRH